MNPTFGEQYLQTRARLAGILESVSRLAAESRAEPATLKTLADLGSSLNEPFLFVVVGEVKAGKSSLLNAFFGKEFCRVDVLPATDRVYVFKHGDPEQDVAISAQLLECYRSSEFLRTYNIVDTPGTNSIVAEHDAITRQFLPVADLVLFVFSVVNPWAASAWEFLQHLHHKWLKKVAFVLQQCDLRSSEEVEAIANHMQQTMLQRIGERCPVFRVSAKRVYEARAAALPMPELQPILASSGFAELESFVDKTVSDGEARVEKLRSVTRSTQVVLGDLAARIAKARETLERDEAHLMELNGSLTERKGQSQRQVRGAMWSLAQSYEKMVHKAEALLAERLTFFATAKLVIGKADWARGFQMDLEERQRETTQKLMRNALDLIEADLKSVWKQALELVQRHFSDRRGETQLPDYDNQREALLRRIETSILEQSSGERLEKQMTALFDETGNWLRVPGLVLAGGGITTIIAALFKASLLDVTGTIAGLGALAGVTVAIFQRSKILGSFRREMADKRDALVDAIERDLTHSLDRFYQDLANTFQPIQTFCATQRRLYEPVAAQLAALESDLGKLAAELTQRSA